MITRQNTEYKENASNRQSFAQEAFLNQKFSQGAAASRRTSVSRQTVLVGDPSMPNKQDQVTEVSPRANEHSLSHLLNQRTLAEMLDVSERTLERMRTEGSGPRFSKAGRRVLYRLEDVEGWLETNSFGSTVEARQKQSTIR